MGVLMADPYANLNPAFSRQLQALINASGGRVSAGSGYRTEAEQKVLYDRYKAGVPGQARAAAPGKSQHNLGLAMDLKFVDDAARKWAHDHAAEYGLYFPMEDEPWHIQPLSPGQEQQSFTAGLQAAGVDPQDELASRLQSVMQVLVGGHPDASTPEALAQSPDQGKYIGSMFTGGGQGTSTPTDISGVTGDVGEMGAYAQAQFQKYGWDPKEMSALIQLWNKESGDPKNTTDVTWNPGADNPNSSAAGIAQKLQSAHGPVEPTFQGQIDWGLKYIADRYGTPSAALAFHRSHNWY